MQIVNKKKTSKLSCDRLAILSETKTHCEVVPFNFRDNTWQKKGRIMKKEHLFNNYE